MTTLTYTYYMTEVLDSLSSKSTHIWTVASIDKLYNGRQLWEHSMPLQLRHPNWIRSIISDTESNVYRFHLVVKPIGYLGTLVAEYSEF